MREWWALYGVEVSTVLWSLLMLGVGFGIGMLLCG